MTRLSVCGLGVSCNEMNDTPMLLVVVTECMTETSEESKRNRVNVFHREGSYDIDPPPPQVG